MPDRDADLARPAIMRGDAGTALDAVVFEALEELLPRYVAARAPTPVSA